MASKPKPRAKSKANPLTKGKAGRDARWIREASAILDEMETWDPDDPRLAPFKTKNWRRKGFPLGCAMGPLYRGPKTIAVLALVVLVGGCLGNGNHSTPAHLDRHAIIDELSETNAHLDRQRDTRHSVEKYRPDLWNRFFARPPAR